MKLILVSKSPRQYKQILLYDDFLFFHLPITQSKHEGDIDAYT